MHIVQKEALLEIGEAAFEDCIYLTEIKFGTSVTTIGAEAFKDCSKLESVSFPKSLKEVCANSFENTPWFNNLRDSETLVIVDGILLYGGKAKGNITIPNTVKAIADSAFLLNYNLTSVTIPDSVTVISSRAFQSCFNIKKVKLGNKVESIGDQAFEYCEKLSEITIPKSVKFIGGYAFSECSKLKTVTVHSKDFEAGTRIFHGTSWLKTQKQKNPLVIVGNNLIDGTACSGKVTVPKGVTRICGIAFDSNNKISSVTLPDTIKYIDFGAFRDCGKLMGINLPNGLVIIGENAFEACNSLKQISIPQSVKEIGESAFFECLSLTTVKNKSKITSIPREAFFNCSKLKEVEIPSTVKSIGASAFCGCKSLSRIDLPKNLERIESSAFASCESLTKINIPNKIKYVGNDAFKLNPWLFEVKGLLIVNHILIDGSNMEGNVVIPDTVTTIAPGAFSNRICDITSVTIPDSVTSIGSGAFSMCHKLKKVKLPKNLKTIESTTFLGCDSLEEITIPDSVTTIGSSAFYYCENLKRVKVSSNLTYIADYAFFRCRKLADIEGLSPDATVHSTAFGETLINAVFYIDIKNEYAVIGKTYELKLKTDQKLGDVVWSVSDKKIAEINSKTGVLTAKKAGEVTITVTSGLLKDSRKLKIVEEQNFKIIGNTAATEGDEIEYTVEGLPKNMDVQWSISDEDMAELDDYGNYGATLRLLKPGKLTLKAKSDIGQGEITITIDKFRIIGSPTIKAHEEAVYTVSGDSNYLDWYLSDEDVAEIYGSTFDKSVTVYGLKEGTVTLVAAKYYMNTETSIDIKIEPNDNYPEDDEDYIILY